MIVTQSLTFARLAIDLESVARGCARARKRTVAVAARLLAAAVCSGALVDVCGDCRSTNATTFRFDDCHSVYYDTFARLAINLEAVTRRRARARERTVAVAARLLAAAVAGGTLINICDANRLANLTSLPKWAPSLSPAHVLPSTWSA